MTTVKLTIYGIVQGVGFRWSAMTLAQQIGLNGTAQNNPDSTVTVCLQGSDSDIARFIMELPHKISPFAKIDKIEKEVLPKVEKMHGFHVLY